MSPGAAATPTAAPPHGGRRQEPKFDFTRLMQLVGAEDMPDMATMLDISVNVVRNFVARGISWSRADEMAVRAGYLPFEVWPEWAEVDPSVWMGPSCPHNHGYDHLAVAADGGEYCQQCLAGQGNSPVVEEVAA